MKQKNWFWCGAVFFALAMFVLLGVVQEPLYAGVSGGLCALASAILLGCGLRTAEHEKAVAEKRCVEEQQAEERRAQEMFDALVGGLRAVKEAVETVEQTITHAARDARERSNSDRAQAVERAQNLCDCVQEQHTALRRILEGQGKEASSFYGFMIDRPWDEIKAISQQLQAVNNSLGEISSTVDSLQSGAGSHLKDTLAALREDNEELCGKLQAVSESLEKQGAAQRDAMERVMQGYADITEQDYEVLTALARDTRE